MWYNEVFLGNVGATSLAVHIADSDKSPGKRRSRLVRVAVPPLEALRNIIQLHRDQLLAKLSLPRPPQSMNDATTFPCEDEIPGSHEGLPTTSFEPQGGPRDTLSARLHSELDPIRESGIREPMTRKRFCNEEASAEYETPNFDSSSDGLLSQPINNDGRSQIASADDGGRPEYKRTRLSFVQELPGNNLDDSTEEFWDNDLLELLASLTDDDA